jgi:hypothetical protein
VLADRISVDSLLLDAKTRFAGRTSGFTRIIKLGVLRSDASSMAIISFVDPRVETHVIAPKQTAKKEVKPTKKPVAKETKTAKKRATTKK